jgi:hypothetical protein
MRAISIGLLLAVCLPCTAADDFKVIELEQDVIELERRVETLTRDLEQLKQRTTGAAATRTAPPGEKCPAVADCSPRWLSAANWSRLREGMSEFEVIDLLGPPSSVRGTTESRSRTLMYALEIGSSAFLSGRVVLDDRRVVEVEKPVLK